MVPVNLVRARHENQHVALGLAGQAFEFVRRHVPYRDLFRPVGPRQVLDFHRVRPPSERSIAHGSRNPSSRAVSSVADMTISLRSGRAACCKSSARASVMSP